jgi:transcriptional regulator with XRE-family HTH domain
LTEYFLSGKQSVMQERPFRRIGARLRTARRLGGLSARKLDALAGTSPGHASWAEAGDGCPSLANFAAWACVLGLSLDWLAFGRAEDAPTEADVRDAVARAHRNPSAQASARTGTEG